MSSAEARDSGAEPASDAVFQPLVDLRAWKVVGFEALARFTDGRSPLEHLADAETRGAREELELHLIRTAARAASPLPHGLFVTLNASGTTIVRPDLADAVTAFDRPIGIELFEDATPVDLRTLRARVTSLGCRLLVDDAGAASADATRIRVLRPDVVKIDRALFWEVAADAAARRRLEALADAARESGAELLVEGVRDAEHVELAKRIGAHLAQGYHLGMPTPGHEIGAMLAELRRRTGLEAAVR